MYICCFGRISGIFKARLDEVLKLCKTSPLGCYSEKSQLLNKEFMSPKTDMLATSIISTLSHSPSLPASEWCQTGTRTCLHFQAAQPPQNTTERHLLPQAGEEPPAVSLKIMTYNKKFIVLSHSISGLFFTQQ